MNEETLALLQQITHASRESLLAGFFVFLRVGAAMAVLPAFGEQSVPQRVKLVLALAFTVVVTPAVMPQLAGLVAQEAVIGLPLATEVVAGFAIGMALRLMVQALQMMGTMAAQATSLSQFFGGAGVEPQPAISQLLAVAGLALAVMAGLHVHLVALFVMSYDLLVPGQFPGPDVLVAWGIGRISHAFALAFSLAAPFVIASFLYNVALGIINRAMPQLMVSFVGAPALALGGLVLLLLVAPLALGLWLQAFKVVLANPFAGAP